MGLKVEKVIPTVEQEWEEDVNVKKYLRGEGPNLEVLQDKKLKGQLTVKEALNRRSAKAAADVEKEGETIRINVKHKPAGATSMLSVGKSGGLSSSGNAKTLGLAPPPSGSGKIRSPLPPPPNDLATARITSTLKGSKESVRRSTDSLSDFSELERSLPSKAGSGMTTSSSAAGWAAF